MKLAFVSSDEIQSHVFVAAAAQRGYPCMALQRATHLGGALPFAPSFVVVALQRLDADGATEVGFVQAHIPAASIIVTAESIPPDARSAALRSGVLDVVQVPYNPFDLITFIEHWHLNRSANLQPVQSCTVFDLDVDLESYIARKGPNILHLTKLELRLLYCLCEHFPNVAPTERLLSFGWGHDGDPDTYNLRTHMSHVRARLRDAGGVPLEIVSRHSIGYTLTNLAHRGPVPGFSDNM